MPKSIVELIGYKLGQKAGQARTAFDLMGGGTEEEALRAEVLLGREMTAAVLEHTPLAPESEATRFAEQIGRWLAGHLKEGKLPFSFKVTGEPVPNALALPGGSILLSQLLLDLCEGERDQIAFVIGHEMGHVVLRHTVERMVQDAAVSLLLRRAPGRQAAGAMLRKVGRQMLTRAFSRENEFEADRFAQSLVMTAGGDPTGGEQLLARLDQRSGGVASKVLGEYFFTHPPLSERIVSLGNSRAG